MRGNTRSSTKTLMEKKKKKRILLVDGTSDWLRIWMAASSLDIKGNKAILANQWFSQIRSQVVRRVIQKQEERDKTGEGGNRK